MAGVAASGAAQRPGPTRPVASVSGTVSILDRDRDERSDVAQAVVWLESSSRVPVVPVEVAIQTSDKEFSPHVVVVPAGSRVSFPNNDAFDHNVFSRSREAVFDLGRYGRGEARSTVFGRPGIVRIYCNIHSHMSAVVVVRDSPYFTQPAADGSFRVEGLAAGSYTLHAWHERAREEIARQLDVGGSDIVDLMVELDTREYEFVQHLNKYGQPYSRARRGRRY